MRSLIAATTVFLALSGVARAETASPPTISVTGEATISAAPDLAQIDAGVTNEAKTAREASSANNAAMGKVLLALKGAGIDAKDYHTAQLSLQPQSTSGRSTNAPLQITGYRASNRVTVKLHDVTGIGSVIDALVTAGANNISGISFTVSNASKLLDEARAKAIDDAHRKAQIYAQAAGVTLGAPLSISEEGTPGPVMYRRMAAPMAAATPIAPGEETLRIMVSVTYTIKAP
ncbi:MAG TPA: SIMPL domain-containing protein [Nitrobacter sp.]|nr:SIMPL domain-containing protein [Nitrobacter sp.]